MTNTDTIPPPDIDAQQYRDSNDEAVGHMIKQALEYFSQVDYMTAFPVATAADPAEALKVRTNGSQFGARALAIAAGMLHASCGEDYDEERFLAMCRTAYQLGAEFYSGNALDLSAARAQSEKNVADAVHNGDEAALKKMGIDALTGELNG